MPYPDVVPLSSADPLTGGLENWSQESHLHRQVHHHPVKVQSHNQQSQHNVTQQQHPHQQRHQMNMQQQIYLQASPSSTHGSARRPQQPANQHISLTNTIDTTNTSLNQQEVPRQVVIGETLPTCWANTTQSSTAMATIHTRLTTFTPSLGEQLQQVRHEVRSELRQTPNRDDRPSTPELRKVVILVY
ncbi:unnamed protein product [Protopolystoma xenopodis]|uniref:Uncharacterized protein n=1 Tax=Protopolystoma xenopodis TaxID=117903 RepID=A0A3S5CI98_9PLAT|nr:unnamed protein product [Protopolystoma xenopodis]